MTEICSRERTFVDKLYAICDYYLDGKTDEHSRHLYDLYKMASIVKINDNLKLLFEKVKEERKQHKACLSAQEGVDMKRCLQEIIDKNVYENDYERITVPLIFENVEYKIVKENLNRILNSGLL